MHTYTLLQWLVLFYVYCFFGWCFESAYVSLLEKRWVNRGFLRSPLLPIYGSGAICILFVCLPVKDNPLAVFVLGIIFPTILEYITGWLMELMFKMRYWDYTDKKCNLKGYICLESSIAWGVMSLLLINFINPPISDVVVELPHWLALTGVIVISVQFLGDFAVSFRAAFNLRRVLEEMERLRTQLEETRVQLELARADTKDKLQEIGQDAKNGYRRRQETLETHAALLRIELARRMERQNRSLYRAILRGNPTASSRRFAASLNQLRELAVKKKNHKDGK